MSHAVGGLFGGGGGGAPATAPAPVTEVRGSDRSRERADLMSSRRSALASAAADDGASLTNNDADLLGKHGAMAPAQRKGAARLLGG